MAGNDLNLDFFMTANCYKKNTFLGEMQLKYKIIFLFNKVNFSIYR